MTNVYAAHFPSQMAAGSIQPDRSTGVHSEPKISRYLSSGPKQLIAGACPICKVHLTEWNDLKRHVENCRRRHQHPLLMRTCYCPFCLKKLSDAYSLSAHIQCTHSANLQMIADAFSRKNGDIMAINDSLNSSTVRNARGRLTRLMAEPFPFACSACEQCWPTVMGLADHFITGEKTGRQCGGFLSVYIQPGSRRMTTMNDNIACVRYDFASPVTCPYCPSPYEEAYALSSHIKEKHQKEQDRLESQLSRLVQKHPTKRYFFAPFSCKCGSTFKSMELWAAHNHERTINGQPCNGELRIMKNLPMADGKIHFASNVAPCRSSNGGSGGDASAAARSPSVEVIPCDNKMVKEEPIDSDELQEITDLDEEQSNHSVPDDPSTSRTAHDTVGGVTVKEEPLDELPMPTAVTDTEQRRVKEEPIDEPSFSHCEPQEVKDDETEEEGAEFDCEECNCVFSTKDVYVAHMKEHGYELADDLDEDQLARLEAGEDIESPPTKKKKEENSPSPSSHSSLLVTHSNSTGNTRQHHSTSIQALPLHYTCTVCRKRRFTNEGERKKHEKECSAVLLWDNRDKAFSEFVQCLLCMKRWTNAYVLLNHFMEDHMDTVEKLRRNYLMASEFLPFRCSACNVGFEDPRVLLNHFRLREEFDIPCSGNLAIHTYQQSLMDFEDWEADNEENNRVRKIPNLLQLEYDAYEDPNSDEWCPRDPQPSEEVDLTGKTECPDETCREQWPRTQIKLHVKMEHPRVYFECAWHTCKICKQYGFLSHSRYAEHYEACKPDQPGPADEREETCAPHFANPMKPASHTFNLPGIPENLGNEMRQCRFCKDSFTPNGLLQHQKKAHPVPHFTDAPYQCLRCEEVGFYSHKEYMKHARLCTGWITADLPDNIMAITLSEIEKRTDVKRIELPYYRLLVDGDRRKYGTLATLQRPFKCSYCQAWCSSLCTLAEHFEDAHPHRLLSLLCGGCGSIHNDARAMREHLLKANTEGNSRCFDKAMLNGGSGIRYSIPVPSLTQKSEVNRFVRTAPLLSTRSAMPSTFNSYGQRTDFKNLSRQEAFERRNGLITKPRPPQLLPIKPLNLMSKSPLSGERHLYERQQVAAARAHNERLFQGSARAKASEMTAQQRQREFARVDFSSPLSLPTDGRRTTPIASPAHPRPSMVYGKSTVRPTFPSLRDTHVGTSVHHSTHRATSSFTQWSSSIPQRAVRYVVRSPAVLTRTPQHIPPPPRLEPMTTPGSRVPKAEPKQEPYY